MSDDPSDADPSQAPPGRAAARPSRALVLLLVALGLASSALVVACMWLVDRTANEVLYVNVGRSVLAGGWDQPGSAVQGPLPLLATQLALGDYPAGGYTSDTIPRDVLFRARLGMLGFFVVLLAAGIAFAWRAAGARAAIVTALALGTQPVLLGHAALTAVDAGHAAFALVAFLCAWRYACTGRASLAAATGAAFGLGLATKALFAVQAPVVLGSVLLLGPRPWRARLGHLLLAGASLVVALHASYGFAGGYGGDLGAVESETLASLLALPGVGALARLLPRTFLAGVDFHLSVTARSWAGGWDPSGRIDPAYFAIAFLVRTPEWMLALGLVLALGARRLLRRGPSERTLALGLVLAGILLPLSFLSLFSPPRYYRYALPEVALFGVWLGIGAGSVRAFAPLALGIAPLFLWHLVEGARQWPDLVSYFNPVSGGPGGARRWFCDSNADWGQHERDGLARLRRAWGEELIRLAPGGGPRIGRLAASLRCSCPANPRDPRSQPHWLDPLSPVGHLASSWWVYDVDLAAYEAAERAAREPRISADLAVAALGAGDLALAARALGRAAGDGRAESLARLLDQEQGGAPSEPAARLGRARLWLELGREDRARALLEREDPRHDPLALELWVEALLRDERYAEARAAAHALSETATTKTLLMLSTAAVEAGELEQGLADLERCVERLQAAGTPVEPWLARLEELRRRIADRDAFRATVE